MALLNAQHLEVLKHEEGKLVFRERFQNCVFVVVIINFKCKSLRLRWPHSPKADIACLQLPNEEIFHAFLENGKLLANGDNLTADLKVLLS